MQQLDLKGVDPLLYFLTHWRRCFQNQTVMSKPYTTACLAPAVSSPAADSTVNY